MDVTKTPSLLEKRTPTLFNLKDADKAGIARIEQSVKSAQDTLALADQLQTMRDVQRALWELEDALKKGSFTLASPGTRFIDHAL